MLFIYYNLYEDVCILYFSLLYNLIYCHLLEITFVLIFYMYLIVNGCLFSPRLGMRMHVRNWDRKLVYDRFSNRDVIRANWRRYSSGWTWSLTVPCQTYNLTVLVRWREIAWSYVYMYCELPVLYILVTGIVSFFKFSFTLRYLYEFVYVWLVSTLSRADAMLIEQEMYESKAKGSKSNKSRNRNKKRHRPYGKDINYYSGLQHICGGFYKVSILWIY